jgi:hypothetical protein
MSGSSKHEAGGALPHDPTSALMQTAIHEVDRLTRRSRKDRIVQWVLGIACVMLIGAGITLGVLVIGANDTASTLRQTTVTLQQQVELNKQNAYSTCVSGNAARVGTIHVWEKFISIILGPHPAEAARQDAATLLSYIKSVEYQRDCTPLKR